MSLINDALKKAERDTGGVDALENAYPQKVIFVAGRQSHNRLLIWLLGLMVLGALAAAALQPSLMQRVLRFGGAPPAPMTKPRLPAPPAQTQSPRSADAASKIQADRRAQVDQLVKAGMAALQSDDVKAARSAFAKAVQLDSASAAVHLGLGLVEKRAGNLADAERHDLEAVRLNANNAEAHNNLALLYDQQGKTDRAIVEYTTALSLRPNYPEAHLNYAIALERVGRTADAKVEYGKFLSNVPPELHDVSEKVQAHLSTLL